MTADKILNFNHVVPTAIKIQGKPDFEKLHFINQLQEDDKTTIYKNIYTMLTKQKFQTFFEQNIQPHKQLKDESNT